MIEAIARAAGVPGAEVRQAVMLQGARPGGRGRPGSGVPGLRQFRLEVGRPLQPMLASTAPSIDAAMERVGEAAVEWKLDGHRIQVHRDGTEVAVFTRTLDDITARVPEVVAAALTLPVGTAVLDGEVIALQPDGRPHPFKVTASRVGSRLDVERLAATRPLLPVRPAPPGRPGPARPAGGRTPRRHGRGGPSDLRIPRTVTADPAAAAGFLDDTLARGHGAGRPRPWPPPGRPAAAKPAGSRSSRSTPSTWSCWPPSGATAVAGLAQQPPPGRP